MPTLSRLLLLSSLLLLFFSSATPTSKDDGLVDDDDDLRFIQDGDDSHFPDPDHLGDDGDFGDFDDGEFGDAEFDSDDAYAAPAIDEKDVVVLEEKNFTAFVKSNPYIMVEFYAPWCGHCQALAPEYAAAATELKDEGVVLAKVDAQEENNLAQSYDVQGFPTVLFFIDGEPKPYPGQRNKDAIVAWIKKKVGPATHNVTTVEDAERILTSEDKVVLGFLDSLVGPESNELAAASKLEDGVNFYQTVNADVAKLFHINPEVKRPSLVMLKKDDEKLSHFDGKFVRSTIAEFVFANKLPLVTIFTKENAPQVFESSIKKQLLLFATSKDSQNVLPRFQEAAKFFKGKVLFVYVELDNEDVGKPVAEYFGVAGDAPTVLAYTGNDDGKKFVLDGEVTVNNVKTFGEAFLEDKLKPFFKSDPIPETNDGDVKVVVGKNFDEIVLDESKDVLLEIYAPWCGHCQSLEPTYNKLAKHLRGINSLVIAKMDGTTNEHPRAKSDGFPTILFFPAGNKSFDPITVDADRTVVAFYKFLKKHASIPFKLQKPTSTPTSKPISPDAEAGHESSGDKDEL